MYIVQYGKNCLELRTVTFMIFTKNLIKVGNVYISLILIP